MILLTFEDIEQPKALFFNVRQLKSKRSNHRDTPPPPPPRQARCLLNTSNVHLLEELCVSR